MRAAKIEGGVVVAVWDVPSLDIYEGVELVEVPDDVNTGWLYSDGSFLAPAITVTPEEIRAARDNLLATTDWMALSDNTMTTEWASYRQALRDITSQSGFPYSVEWPAAPGE